MRKKLAERMAKKLIKEHCPEYTLKWIRAERKFGYCDRAKKIIALSHPLTKLNTEERVKDTILHEIAHALTTGGHNKEFYAMCNHIGAEPRRTYSSKNTISPPRKPRGLEYKCPGCDKRMYRRTMMGRRQVACRICCNKNGGGFQEQFIFEFVRRINK